LVRDDLFNHQSPITRLVSQPIAYIPANAASHATVEISVQGVTVTRPMIGLRRAGAVFATTLTVLCGFAVWALASLDPNAPLTPLGLSLISVSVAALCAYAWVNAIDEASRRYVLFASPAGLQIRSEGLLGERNEWWQTQELTNLWLARVPKQKSDRCRQIVVKVKSGEVVSVLSYLELAEDDLDVALRGALGWSEPEPALSRDK
jgi:hypothetical protein